MGLLWKEKFSLSKITTNLLELKPSCKNNIFYSLSQQFKSKRRSFYLQNWQIYGLFYLKTKMGMAGLIFEPRPPYFANQCNFCRCTNDVTMTFWYLYWFQICKKPLGVSFPGSSVLWIPHPEIGEGRNKLSPFFLFSFMYSRTPRFVNWEVSH